MTFLQFSALLNVFLGVVNIFGSLYKEEYLRAIANFNAVCGWLVVFILGAK